jgi:hypothetical protein
MSKGSSTTANKEITCDPLNFFCTAEALWLTDNFYNNTEIHWHVVKWPPIFPFKSVERKPCLWKLREGWQGQALHKKALPKLRPHLQTAMVPTAKLFMSDVVKACSRSAKKRTAWGAGTHKNRATDVIPNQNSVFLLLGPSIRFFFFCNAQWNVGMSDAAKACSRSVKKRTVWRSCDTQNDSSTLFLLTYLTSLVTYLLTYSLIYLLID